MATRDELDEQEGVSQNIYRPMEVTVQRAGEFEIIKRVLYIIQTGNASNAELIKRPALVRRATITSHLVHTTMSLYKVHYS